METLGDLVIEIQEESLDECLSELAWKFSMPIDPINLRDNREKYIYLSGLFNGRSDITGCIHRYRQLLINRKYQDGTSDMEKDLIDNIINNVLGIPE